MADKAWKAFERRIAKSLGTVRTPLSGGASRHTRSDTLHPDLYVECKARRKSTACAQFDIVRLAARGEGKEPVLALHQTPHKATVAVIDWRFFIELWECYHHYVIMSGLPPGDFVAQGHPSESRRKGVTHE